MNALVTLLSCYSIWFTNSLVNWATSTDQQEALLLQRYHATCLSVDILSTDALIYKTSHLKTLVINDDFQVHSRSLQLLLYQKPLLLAVVRKCLSSTIFKIPIKQCIHDIRDCLCVTLRSPSRWTKQAMCTFWYTEYQSFISHPK